jgi:hypothetical protein
MNARSQTICDAVFTDLERKSCVLVLYQAVMNTLGLGLNVASIT